MALRAGAFPEKLGHSACSTGAGKDWCITHLGQRCTDYQPTIKGRTSANFGYSKPIFACVHRTFWRSIHCVGACNFFLNAVLEHQQVKRIRGPLADRGVPGLRDLALFSTAIDTMLHGQDLLPLVVGDVQRRDGSIRPVIEVARARGMPPVRCALSKASTKALEKWITTSGKKRTDHLFPGRGVEGRHPMGQRQLNRLLKLWVVEAGLDPSDYSVESLRRTKALHILKGTGDLQTVRALLGHARIESTARYLGLKTKADPIEVCRAFDI